MLLVLSSHFISTDALPDIFFGPATHPQVTVGEIFDPLPPTRRPPLGRAPRIPTKTRDVLTKTSDVPAKTSDVPSQMAAAEHARIWRLGVIGSRTSDNSAALPTGSHLKTISK